VGQPRPGAPGGPAAPTAPPVRPPSAWPTPHTAPPGTPGFGGAPTEASGHGSLGLALAGGVAGAFVSGLIWWGIVATTRFQATFVAIAVGWVVAQAVLIGCTQRNRLPLQAIAGVSTLVALVASEYFIQRTLFIKEFGDRAGTIPLWDGFGSARDVVQTSLEEDPLTGLFWVAAVIAAIAVAGTREALTDRN
jgi:hypothetical protein